MKQERKQLTFEDRVRIYDLAKQGKGCSEIGRITKRNKSIISREVKRNAFVGNPSIEEHITPFSLAQYAENKSKERRSKSRIREQRLKTAEIESAVTDSIKENHWYPDHVSNRIGDIITGAKISTSAIYNWIHEVVPELKAYLPRLGKNRKKKGNTGQYTQRKPAACKRSISKRTEEINNRERFGDWEGDLIVDKFGKVSILTLIERKSRFVHLLRLENKLAETAKQAMIEGLGVYPSGLVKSITLDNGSENALHPEIEKALKATIFFCHPYCSWEKGSVENANRSVRVFVPKGKELRFVQQKHLNWIEHILNNRPKKCLGYKTPNEVFCLELEKYGYRYLNVA